MSQACRPAGRLFYWVLAVVVTASCALGWAREEASAGEPATSPTAKPGAAASPARAASPTPQSGPPLTSVVDTVYLAGGTPAQGVLVITWPAFVTAAGTAVAPGALNVTLGANGALNVALASNAGANPPGVYYTVVYQLGPGEVRTEYWLVPTSSPATLAQVRTTPGSGTAAPAASVQYVNTVAATKANDNAVVHLAGAETVTGTKTFAASPNVPTPVGTGDVTNKSYVDAAIANVGAGNFLPLAGGAMTGPLTLSGNPTAPLQASPKQYVDLSAAAKADLVSGLVPTSELGSGAASALNCLLGNGTWGSCASSANATAIQSVPVGATAPTNGQVLTYSSTTGQYAPATPTGGTGGVSVSPASSQNIAQPAGTQFSANNLSGIHYVTPSDNWTATPTSPATLSVGSNTISLSACPRGLTTQAVGLFNYYSPVYISTAGTAEAAPITATTCTQQGGAAGTITVTAANSHGAGYTVGTASQGVQEAIYSAPISANFTSTAQELGTTVIPPGQYTWKTRVTVLSSTQVVDFSGSVVTCTMPDTCLMVGTTAHPSNTWDVTIKNFTGQAGCNNCNFPMIEDAGQKTRLIVVGEANPNPVGTATSGSSFGSLIQVDNDQSATVDGLSAYSARWYHCDTTFCSVAVKGAGGAGNSGVLYIKNSNMNLSCGANGVDNQDSNTLRISDSVIESQAQFAVRSSSTYSNVPNVELDNVYMEVAGCAGSNPLGIGIAGLIVENGFASVKNSVGPTGASQVFLNNGTTQYNYYIVAHSSSGAGLTSAPFLAGIALTNGTGSVPVAWPQFGTTATVTYDVIRTSGQANNPAPYLAICGGGSTTACGTVATGLTTGSACGTVGTAHICSFTDTASTSTAAATSSNLIAAPTYWPAFGDGSGAGVFWNGAVVYTTAGDAVGISPITSGVHFDRYGDNVTNSALNPVNQSVSSFGNLLPKIFAQDCSATYGGVWISCLESASASAAGATLLQSGGYNTPDPTGLKGRLIFEQGLYGNINGGHKITLVDSSPAKTLATAGMRPGSDANDTYVGLDNAAGASASSAQLAFGAPVSISHYIGNVGDNTSFLERLTASAKTFNVPITVNGTVTVNGQLQVAGPWMVSSPIPGTAMAAAGAGTSALGISNDGNFYISANAGTPQKVATTATSSYFSNLFQEDANDLGEYNGTTPQSLHVYSSYTNSSTWQRTSLGYDATDNYAVVRSENSTSGAAPGLGFWVNSGLKWVVDASSFLIPVIGARVTLGKTNGSDVFTGYVTAAPQYEYLGWGEQGPVYRYNVVAESDEVLLDQKALPNRSPFVDRSAGNALRQLAQDLLPGYFNTSAVQDMDTLAIYAVNPQKSFSFHAAELAVAARASFRSMNGMLILAPAGAASYALSESDANFSPEGLWLNSPNLLVNELTVIGQDEPKAFVRDYFVGDGLSLKFYLSQKPFAQSKQALIDENYLGPSLDPATWVVDDPSAVISVAAQTLLIAGGTGVDGQTTVSFIEQVELGGALELQHGDVSFTAASRGVFGGLYAGAISAAGCLAGFQIAPAGANSTIQALINGLPTGPVMTTTPGHRYFFTTYLYSMEVYRSGETYHSSLHPSGSGWGGAAIAADVRFVLEVQDIDPSNSATLVAPATVLYDGVITSAPGFCTYALVNAMNMQCSVAYTYVAHISLAEVRTALPSASYVTQLVGALSEGAACEITSSPSLDFFPAYVPALNELIVASYRGHGRAVAQVQNAASVALLHNGADDGTRGSVRAAKTPGARTDVDCENAALAILDDATGAAWSGIYETWSDFLPGAAGDIFPGDAVEVNVRSRGAVFTAIVREVAIHVADPANDRGIYTIGFANDLAAPLGMEFEASAKTIPLQDMPPILQATQAGAYYQANLTEAQITAVTSTTVQVDAGMAPASGFGIEVREHDFGWGQANDRNLLGRFSTQTFSLPRLARTQNYFLRLYDNSSPPKYSRYSAALHIDYPL